VVVEPPRASVLCDISTNAVMLADNHLTHIKRDHIASIVVEGLKEIEGVEDVQLLKGFVNIVLSRGFWINVLRDVIKRGELYGDNELGGGELLNIEFVSANPTGPLHIGHARSAIYGHATSNLLRKSKYIVTSEYYINDAGRQIELLVESLYIRYLQVLGDKHAELGEGHYPGDYLIEIANDLFNDYGSELLEMDEESRFKVVRDVALGRIMDSIRTDLGRINVFHDVFISEQKDIIDKKVVDHSLEILMDRGLAYYGYPEKPKSCEANNWEPQIQLLLKSRDYGDEADRTIRRSDGSNTYFASDVAYHMDKIRRGFRKMILLLGVDHAGYVKRMQVAVDAVSGGEANLTILLNALINLQKDGKSVKMSKRAGEFVTLSDLLQVIDADVLRFAILMKKNNTTLDLDIEKVKEQSKDNPVFYVQYAHARCVSVISKARNASIIGNNDMTIEYDELLKKMLYNYGSGAGVDLSKIKSEEELDLIKMLALFPKVVLDAAIHKEVHRISYYLYKLAKSLHSLWSSGMGEINMRLIVEGDDDLSRARVALVFAVASVIGNGLAVLGVKPVMKL